MFIENVPNRDSPPAILLRESYRDDAGKSQKRTLANLSKLPASLIAGLKGLLKAERPVRRFRCREWFSAAPATTTR
jgi:hypothetical protein